MTSPDDAIDVAVGVVQRPDGAVLLGQRPPGKPYAGWWEFPGGKLERGESVHAALVRELDEELGLRVQASCPWVVRRFVYPHATVRLHFRRVLEFDGVPRGREGQAFAWCSPGAIDRAPLLPATVPVIGWLALPATCIRSSAATMGVGPFVDALESWLRAGSVRLLALDEPDLPPDEFDALFHPVLRLCRAHSARLVVASRHADSFARAAGGVLLGADALRTAVRRPDPPLAIARARDASDVARASSLGFDAVWIDPPTDGVEASAAALALLVSQTGLPAYAGEGWAVDSRSATGAGAHGTVRTVDSPKEEETMELAALQSMLEPMFPGLMGVRLEVADPDRVVATLPVRPDLCTAGGTLHGGAFMAFADTLGALATVLNMPEGARTTTIESKTNFLSGAPVGTIVRAECTPLHKGRTTMVWQTVIGSESGKRCAVVIQTQLVMPGAG